ncbi:MAG: hypothetical protein RIS82_1138 [Actinomycetota bacterium]|jgi:hypothetical protein
MSEILKVAASLRQMSDAQLEQLIAQRMVSSPPLRDFFDLAEVLIKPASVSAAIAGLPKSQARALVQLVNDKQQTGNLEPLVDLALIDAQLSPFESTIEALSQFDTGFRSENLFAVSNESGINQDQIDRDSGVVAFETMQAITELIFDLEQRFVKEVGKKTVGLPDLKRLANHLNKTTDYAREIYEVAGLANLIFLDGGRWQLGSDADQWLIWQPWQRLKHLSQTWREILGDASAAELLEALTAQPAPLSLSEKLRLTYPFADGSVNSKISRLSSLAELLGLATNGWMSSWTMAVLGREFEAAAALARSFLPAEQSRLICQADLSIIAPGPLPTELEMQLRRFANTEQIGMASTYRLSKLSLSHGLETGMKASEIRELLERLSEKKLPQPVEYLIQETEQRFGRLTVADGGDVFRSEIRADDQILLAAIINEAKLKPFALQETQDGALISRFEPEVVYLGLREIGLAAVRIDDQGQVISPTAVHQAARRTEVETSIRADIARLREQDAKIGEAPDGDDLHRQIQLAIKNKAKAWFTVKTNDGSELLFLLEPIGIANGRLRAKDRKADIERTVPMASITKVSFD